jgi:hypothetical protein
MPKRGGCYKACNVLRRALLLCALAPGLLRAQVLAEAGPLRFGDGGADALPPVAGDPPRRSLILPFDLTRSAQVGVEVQGLRYVDQGPNAAPELFLDEEYLGPLLAELGSAWRSPRSIKLGPGRHQLLLRNAQVAEAEDFVLKRIFVYAGLPASPAKALSRTATVQASPVIESGCGRPRRDWPPAKQPGITLSVLSGQVVGTGELVHLSDGETWSCGIKISAPYKKPLALMAGFEKKAGIQGRWILSLDPDPPARVEPMGYKPARWERFQAAFCQGTLTLRFGQAPPLRVPWVQKELSLEIAAQSVEVALRPTP